MIHKKFDLIFFRTFFYQIDLNLNFLMNNILINIKKIPKVMFLNKEYVNLRQKLRFIEENNVNLVFSHHHLALYLNKFYNKKFIFYLLRQHLIILKKKTIKNMIFVL